MTLAALAFLVALYCLSGVAMNIQFTLATENAGYATAAVLWGLGALLTLAGTIVLARAAWKGRRMHQAAHEKRDE
jgi:hypothetical protein